MVEVIHCIDSVSHCAKVGFYSSYSFQKKKTQMSPRLKKENNVFSGECNFIYMYINLIRGREFPGRHPSTFDTPLKQHLSRAKLCHMCRRMQCVLLLKENQKTSLWSIWVKTFQIGSKGLIRANGKVCIKIQINQYKLNTN